jgi:hypothetical protein
MAVIDDLHFLFRLVRQYVFRLCRRNSFRLIYAFRLFNVVQKFIAHGAFSLDIVGIRK